jgi:hypothetical protein
MSIGGSPFAYSSIGIVLVAALVSIFFAVRRRGRKRTAGSEPGAGSRPVSVQGISSETAEKLLKLRRLLDLGLITQEDYEDQRKRLSAG